MQVKGTSRDAIELLQPPFGEAPEALDAIDVIFAARKLVLMMMDAVMLVATQNKAVIGLPAVGIKRWPRRAPGP